MKKIIENFVKKYGYKPTIFELNSLYTNGALILSNKQENEY